MASPRRWRPTLRLTISVVLSGMILITAAVLTISSYLTTRETLLDFSRGLIAQNAQLVREQVDGFVRPAASAAELTVAMIDSGAVDVADPHDLERYFFDYLRVEHNVAMLNWGDERGGFLMVKRQPDGSLSTKIITVADDGTRQVRWRHRDPGGPLEPPLREELDPDDEYDPRARPWYRGASGATGLYWTGVYVFHTDRQPGVTAAVAWRDASGAVRGVVSVDIGLAEMSHFLRDNIRVGESGGAVLLDEDSRLIAIQEPDQLTVADAGGGDKRRLRQLAESTRPEVEALAGDPRVGRFLAAAFESGGGDPEPITVRYSTGDRDYVATLMSVRVGSDRRWVAAVVALEDEFLATARAANLRSLITALVFAAVAMVIAILLSRMIARSLTRLVEESTRVRNMDIDSSESRSKFREVDEVLVAFEGMKTGLRAFQKYVPVKLVRSLIEHEQEAALGGQPRRLTIFFSDIRGFTGISEGMSPTRLAESLARYLSAVTERISQRQGTVDKYIGDAVMAFWGAPQDVPDHASQACLAAFEALREVDRLSEDAPEMPEFFTRIGIHTAEVVVGNFGSDDRLNYTIIGDGVNLASRLEGVNKVFGTQILISEDTRAAIGDAFVTRRIGLIAVKGRGQPCVTYELLGPSGSADDATLAAIEHYERGLEAYLDRRWDDAVAEFEAALTAVPDDQPSRVLLALARELRAEPPGDEWDGAISIETK